MSNRQKAMTIVEVIVVIAIILIILALLLPAIQHARLYSIRLESKSNIKSLMFGMLQYSTERAGKLPGVSLANLDMTPRRYPLYVILPYLDVGFNEPWGRFGKNSMEYPQVKYYLSPSDISTTDPTMKLIPQHENTSYSTNARVFDGLNRMGTISDGLSYTIGISERYRGCYNNGINPCEFYSMGVYPLLENGRKVRTSTFADSGYADVVPITSNNISNPSIPGVTFQRMPSVENADGRLLQSTHPAGLLTIMMDCSIREIGNDIKASVFWGAITPTGNELISFVD